MKTILYTIVGLILIVSVAAQESKVSFLAGVFGSTGKMPLITISIVFLIFFFYFFFSFLKRFKHHMAIKKQKEVIQKQSVQQVPVQSPQPQTPQPQTPVQQPIQQQSVNQVKNIVHKKEITNKIIHLKKVVEQHKEKQDVFHKLRDSF